MNDAAFVFTLSVLMLAFPYLLSWILGADYQFVVHPPLNAFLFAADAHLDRVESNVVRGIRLLRATLRTGAS